MPARFPKKNGKTIPGRRMIMDEVNTRKTQTRNSVLKMVLMTFNGKVTRLLWERENNPGLSSAHLPGHGRGEGAL